MQITAAVLGVNKSGKTMLINRIADNGKPFTETYSKTYCHGRSYAYPGDLGELVILDTSMEEKIAPEHILAYIYYLVVDPTQEIEPQLTYLETFVTPPYIHNIIITKADLLATLDPEELRVKREKIAAFQQKLTTEYGLKCGMLETSSKDATGIDSLKASYTSIFQDVKAALRSAEPAEEKTAVSAATTRAMPPTTSSSTNTSYMSTQPFNAISDTNYYVFFRNLSSFPHMNEKQQDREKAKAIFDEQLEAAGDDLNKIQKLITTAEPYINRHRNPLRDNLCRNKITTSWSQSLGKARVKAIAALDEKVANKDPSVTDEMLTHWYTQSLFAEHRSNSIFKGAFGKTIAQAKIEDLMWDLHFRV